jgi:hypothetical protein
VAVGLVAGIIAWTASEMTTEAETPTTGSRGQDVRTLPHVIGIYNATVSYEILGATLGLFLGLAGGLIRRSVLGTILAAVIGLVLGFGAAMGSARWTLPLYFGHLKTNELMYAMTVHCATWTAIGGVAGLAFGLGLGGWGRMIRGLVGGAGGALLGTVIYEFAGIMLFPLDMTDRPLSRTWYTRLLARLLVSGLAAAGAALGAGTSPTQTE